MFDAQSFSTLYSVFGDYLNGAWLTLQLLLLSVLLGFVLSVILANLKTSRIFIFEKSIGLFTYYFRGTPLLIQIFLIYYGLGQFEVIRESFMWVYLKEPYFCAILALTLNNAGYVTEFLANAIESTDKGEIEAAKSFGMNRLQRIMYIVTPSALRRSIPSYGNEVIFMLHATSLVSTITLFDLTGVAKLTYARFFIPFEAFMLAALFYIIFSYTIIRIFRTLEKRYLGYLQK